MIRTPFTHVFAVPGKLSIIDVVREDGRSAVLGETLEEVQQRYPLAELMTWESYQAEKVRQQNTPISWIRVTQKKFNDMLEVLPPLAWTAKGFLVGEAYDHSAETGLPRYQAYLERQGQFFASSRPLTVKEWTEVR